MPWASCEEPHDTNPRRVVVAKRTLPTGIEGEDFLAGQITRADSPEILPEWRFGAEVVTAAGKSNLGYFQFAAHAKEAIDAYWEKMAYRFYLTTKHFLEMYQRVGR